MRSLIPGVLAMAIIVLASNILVQFLAGDFLTWGAFTYPFAFLVTDLVNRFQGTPAARKVVWAGFATGLACSIVGTQIQGEFGPLVTLRVAIASGAAFLVAQFLDIAVFNRFRGQTWWRAPFFATMAGSSLDTLTFFSIAFASAFTFLEPGNDVAWANELVPLLGQGPALPLWVSMAVADWSVKLLIAIVALLPFRLAIARYAARLA